MRVFFPQLSLTLTSPLLLAPLVLALATLAACGSKIAGSDAGVSADEEALAGERGEDARFTWTTDVVIDRKTGLAWQRRVDEARVSWDDAHARCRALEVGGEAAGTWRVPTRDELLTILDGDTEHPALGGKIDWYWSSTRSENVESAAWVVGIARYTNTHAFETQSPVRCVR